MLTEKPAEKKFEFERFFELSADLLCISGYDGYFKKINPAVSKLLGYSMDELYARPINDFVFEADKNITASVRLELTQRKPLYNFENRYVTKSGDIIWLSWTSLPVNEDQLIFAIAKDITHKKKLEAERNALLVNLTNANEALKKISYTTSHDLRSPVNNLLSVFDLIDVTKIQDDYTLVLFDILKSAGTNLHDKLNHYVDLLTRENEDSSDVGVVVLADCLQRVQSSISSLIETSKAKFIVDFSALPQLTFNQAKLESIFLNLITNAIKYKRTNLAPEITIIAKPVDGFNQIIIADNCMGFDMEKVKDKIFGMHQKFHEHADSKGVGLYLVHSHVTSAGGTITVNSKINEGTTFMLSFPS